MHVASKFVFASSGIYNLPPPNLLQPRRLNSLHMPFPLLLRLSLNSSFLFPLLLLCTILAFQAPCHAMPFWISFTRTFRTLAKHD